LAALRALRFGGDFFELDFFGDFLAIILFSSAV
jgi:hypothetical protein